MIIIYSKHQSEKLLSSRINVGRIGVLALAHFARRRMPGFSKFLEFVAVLPVNLAYLSYTYKILRYIFEESASDFLSKN